MDPRFWASFNGGFDMTVETSSYQSLRVMLEVRLPMSAMLVVSSACPGDGQDELACGLACAFAESDKRTAVISLYETPSDWLGSANLQLRGFTGSFFKAPAAAKELHALVTDVCLEHDVVIVASPPLLTKSASLDLCRLGNGVLFAVRLGRKISSEDQEAVAQLQRVEAKLLGTVAMRPAPAHPALTEHRYGPAWSLEAASDLPAKLAASAAQVKPLLQAMRTHSNKEALMWLISIGILAALVSPIR